jgi:hypothetical protein
VPWPGLLIGGPHGTGFQVEETTLKPSQVWTDTYENYEHNEVAINWSTAFVYAAAVAVATQGDESAECQPDCLGEPSTGGAGGQGGAGG